MNRSLRAFLFAIGLSACGARSGLDVPLSGTTSSTGAGGSGGSTSAFHCKAGDPPVALASGLTWPYGIVTDDAFVYFTTYDKMAGAVWRVPKAGGTAEPIAPHLDFPDQLVLVGGVLYAAEAGGNRVIRVPTTGGPVTTLVGGQSGVSGIASDGADLYWTNYLGDQIGKSDLSGAMTKTFGAAKSPFRIAAGADRVYYTSFAPGLQWISKTGSPAGEIPSPTPRSVAVGTDGRVYWTDHGLFRANADGTGMEAFGDFEHGKFFDGLALDQDHVFVAIAEGDIVRFSLHGEAPVTLFTGQNAPAIVAVDATCVYWTNTNPGTTHGTVMRGPKAG